MPIKITQSNEKLTPPKKNIQLKDIYVKNMKFIDETGDITQDVLDAIPEDVETVNFKISIELPEVDSSGNE